MTDSQRLYEKGENRTKHEGKRREAWVLVVESGEEIGKCPKGFSLATAQELIAHAIEEHRRRQPDVPFRLWTYHDGAIYQARSSDGGTTWHGYPVSARHIPDNILTQIEARAATIGESDRLKKWLKKKWAIKRS